MADEQVRVAPAELVRAAATASDAYESLSKRLQMLQSKLEELKNSWTGAAASSFLDVWAEIESDSRDMLRDVKHIANSLDATADSYVGQEEVTAKNIQTSSLNLRD